MGRDAPPSVAALASVDASMTMGVFRSTNGDYRSECSSRAKPRRAGSRRHYPGELRQGRKMSRVWRSPPLLDEGCIFLRHRKGAPNIGGADRGKARLYYSQIPAVQDVPIGGVIGCPFT